MKLGAHLLRLLAPFQPGDEVAPGAKLAGVLSELGLGWTFHTPSGDVHVQVALAKDADRFAAKTPRLALSYRVAGVGDGAAGKALCEAIARIVQANEDDVLRAMEEEAAAEREANEGGLRIREVVADRILEPSLDGPLRFFTVSPYVGCVIGCRFCYAQTPIRNVRRLTRVDDVAWGSYVDVRMNAAELLARELEGAPPLPIKFCPILSDPYQAVERHYGVTRACLEALRDAAPRPVMLLTRSTLIERDVDLLAALPDAWAGFSLPTIDDAVRRHFEPRAAPIRDRLRVLGRLREHGVKTFAVVQPVLPGSIEELAAALSEVVSSVSIDVLHGVEGASAQFSDSRYRVAAEPSWQQHRASELRAALTSLGVEVWGAELPRALVR